MIVFHTACAEPRPVRLSEQTRRFALDSLQGRYGDEAVRADCVDMTGTPGFETMTALQKYDVCIRKICEDAPLRVVPGESVSGAATLGMAIRHMIPARFGGKDVLPSVSHLTVDFESVLRLGMDRRQEKIREHLADPSLLPRGRAFLQSADACVESMRVYHARYLKLTKSEAPKNYGRLVQVPFGPARSFREAVQSLWFCFSFLRLCGNWPGLGCLDRMLGGYLSRDLASGEITLDEAREFLAGFFIKGCEWIQSDAPRGSGDAQHYQNIVLGGKDADGRDVTNEATGLVLDIVEELPIGDFPIAIRLNPETPESLKRHAARVVRHGGGVVAFYNEPLILRTLTAFGYGEREAHDFANDGCWEVQLPGRTCFGYYPFDGLGILLRDTLRLHEKTPAHFDCYDDLRCAYGRELKAAVERIYRETVSGCFDESGAWREAVPCTAVSIFENSCVENAASYFEGGPDFRVLSPHIGGAPDVGNSLIAIDRLCFREKKVSFDELMHILQNNWKGEEALRQYALNRIPYYGNDNPEADRYTADVLREFASDVQALNGRCPIRFPAGISTFGRQIEWAPERGAVPFGRRAGDILSGNASPTPGTDLSGATAVVSSYCALGMEQFPCGAALDLRLHPSAVSGENGLAALVSLMDGFCTEGGFFVQIDAVDAATLREAQKNPEGYKTLSVRVSGWNARFVTLDDAWQQMVIERTEQGL